MRRRRVWPLLFCIALGVTISASTLPFVQTELAIRKLFSDDASSRRQARVFFQRQRGSGAALRIRLRHDPVAAHKIISRLAHVESDHIFIDVVGALRSAGWWTPQEIPIDLWLRRCQLQLDTKDNAAAIDVMAQLRALSLDDRNDSVQQIWQNLIQWPQAPVVREMALTEAAAWWGPRHVEYFIAPALNDPNPRVRRIAWLLMGHLKTRTDSVPNWADEPPQVAHAILWALTNTNRDSAQPLLDASQSFLNQPETLTWLLALSKDPRAHKRLIDLAHGGSPSAAYHLAAATDPSTIDLADLPPIAQAHAAWLGRLDPTQLGADGEPMLARWAAWRRNETTPALLSRAVATDGSVWSAVLLADRTLEHEDAANWARRWLTSLDDDERRAGLGLAGLLRIRRLDNSQILEKSLVTQLRRAARLARLVNSSRPTVPRSSDLVYAWRVLDNADRAGEPTQSALIALLGAGDVVAAQWMLDPALSRSHKTPGRRMLEYAWLIERFFPDAHALIGLPCPWDDDVAALQFDILRTGLALAHRSNRFTLNTRTFNLTIPSPTDQP